MPDFYEFESYPAFIDESVDMSEREIGYYVLSAVILLDENSEATKSLLERDLNLGFKASKHSSQKKHRTLHAFGDWISTLNFMAICSYVAWIVRRHINGDGSEFMNYIKDKTEIYQIRCEANRGQPRPLV